MAAADLRRFASRKRSACALPRTPTRVSGALGRQKRRPPGRSARKTFKRPIPTSDCASQPQKRLLALSHARERRTSNNLLALERGTSPLHARASAENGHGTAFWHGSRPCRPPFAAKPRRNPRSRKSTGRSRPDFGPVPCQNAVPWPFSRRFPAQRALRGARRTARDARRALFGARHATHGCTAPRPVATGSAPPPTRPSGESPPIRTPHAAYRTTYDMRRAPHSARRTAPRPVATGSTSLAQHVE